MRALIAAAAILMTACSHLPPEPAPPARPEQRMFTMPGEAVTRPGPDCALRLEPAAPLPPLVVGRKVSIPFVARNITAKPVRSCVVAGLSARIRSASDGVWRIVRITGFTTDTDCSYPLRLEPEETVTFPLELFVFPAMPPGAATLHVILGMDRYAFGRECGEALEWEQEVTLGEAQAN